MKTARTLRPFALLLPIALAAWGCSSSSSDPGVDGQGGDGAAAAGAGGGGGAAGGAGGRAGGSGGSSTNVGVGGSGGEASGGGGAAGAPATGGTAGSATAGAAGGTTAGAGGGTTAGAGGAAPTAGTSGAADKTKEQVLFDGMVTMPGDANVHPPMNWFAPIDYWRGQTQVRFDVSKAPAENFSIELCMWKSSPSDPKHTCARVVLNSKGPVVYDHAVATSSTFLNSNAMSTMTEDDFKSGFVLAKWRLTPAGNHQADLAGSVTGRITIVLVPAGLAFSGWAGYVGK